jgi:hypothetical protein
MLGEDPSQADRKDHPRDRLAASAVLDFGDE